MSRFQELCDAYRDFLAEDANDCVQLGLLEKLDQLPDPSLAGSHKTRERAQDLRRMAESLAPQLDDFHQRLDAGAGGLRLRKGQEPGREQAGDTHLVGAVVRAFELEYGYEKEPREGRAENRPDRVPRVNTC